LNKDNNNNRQILTMTNNGTTQHPHTILVQARKIVWAILALSSMRGGPIAIHAAKAIPTDGAPICNSPDKHIYVMAGPRRSATTSVADFFYQYARGAQPNRDHGRTYHPLAKFRWPMVYGPASNETETEMPYKRFNHLVSDYDNEPLRKEILEAIKRDYDIDSVNSIIFGGEEFEQVGVHAQDGYDAIRAVWDVVDITGASPGCVTVLLNYRAWRFEHWVSLYGNGMMENPGPNSKEEPMPYNEHMCMDDTTADRLQELGTSMNPMYLAEIYLGQGFNVKMIDMAGIENAGTDISHTIACKIMGGVCDGDGWVKNHVDEVITNKALKYDFKHLSEEEIELSEKLFRYRDCAFEEDLRANVQFELIMDDEIWFGCDHDKDHEWIYQSFRDPIKGTKLFFDALLSQVDCQEYGGVRSALKESMSEKLETAKIDEFLDGTYQKSNLMAAIEEIGDEISSGHFSIPLVLVVVMFALGGGFFMGKLREDRGYRLPGIEMAGGSAPRSGSGAKRRSGFSDENDDDDSSSSSSDDDDDEEETTNDFI